MDVPAGEWTVVRIGHTTTGKTNPTAPPTGQGLEVDKFSPGALERFWRTFPETLIADAGAQAGKTFKRFEVDSYEAGPQDWTPLMRDEFKKRRNYDPLPWLLTLNGESNGGIGGDDGTGSRRIGRRRSASCLRTTITGRCGSWCIGCRGWNL